MLTGFGEKPSFWGRKGYRKTYVSLKIGKYRQKGGGVQAYKDTHANENGKSISNKLHSRFRLKKNKQTGKIFLHIFDSFSRVINYQTHKSFPTRSSLFISLWFAFNICLSEDDGAFLIFRSSLWLQAKLKFQQNFSCRSRLWEKGLCLRYAGNFSIRFPFLMIRFIACR